MTTSQTSELLFGDRATITVPEAAAVIGISRSTAIRNYQATGNLIEGVPIIRAGRRVVVSTVVLRRALGHKNPERTSE